MKIIQLELSAFGKFTQTILHFSSAAKLHIIYGVNETGKSTTRRAINALLFGIPERTTDAYIHNNDKLRLGAHLQDNVGNTLVCYRRKGRKNTLNDAIQRPIEETILQKMLGGLTEAQFTTLFCFDHERLRQGGEDLLAGGGQVGESLFEAGTGHSQLHELMDQLEKEMNDIFKQRGSIPKLNKTIQNHKKLQQQLQENSLPVDRWKQVFQALEETKKQHHQITEKLYQLRAEQHKLTRIQRTLPLLQRHNELGNKLAKLKTIILLPDNAATKRIEVSLALSTAQSQEKQAKQAINDLESQLQAIHISDVLLAQKATLDHLRERLGSHLKAARDLPGVRTEMRTVEAEAQKLLQRIYPNLTVQNISTIQLTNQQQEHIRQLADNYPALQEKHNSLIERTEQLTQQLADCQQQLTELPTSPDLTELRTALSHAMKQGNLEEMVAKMDKEVRLLTVKAEISLKQLGLWQGNLTNLLHLALPGIERIDNFDRRFKEIENDKERIKERGGEARQRHNRASQAIEALRFEGDIPNEQELTQIRQQRQHYWQMIKKGTLSPQLSQSFENSIFHADEVADRLRREAQRVAEQAHLLAEQQSAAQEQDTQTKKWRKAEEMMATARNEWEECWKPYDLQPWAPNEMRTWLMECIELRNQVALLQEKRVQLEIYQQLMHDISQELMQALTQLSDEFSPLHRLNDLLTYTESAIAEVELLQRKREDLQKQIKNITIELQKSEKSEQQTNNKLQKWQVAWQQAILPLTIAADTEPKIVRHILDVLEQIFNKTDKINSLKRRIDLMERDAELFRQDVNKLVENVAIELVNLPAEEVVPTLSNRLSQTEKEATRSEQLQQRLYTEQQRYSKAVEAMQISEAQLQALLTQARCDDVATLEIVEKASVEKKLLQRELTKVEQHLLELGEGMSLIELANSVENVDINRLPSELEHYREEIQLIEQQRSEIDRQIGELQLELKQMDGNAKAAEIAEEIQSTLAECVELSHHYMQLYLARLVLQTTIENYRKQHQAPLLQRASELFQQLTLKQFHGLDVGYQSDTDQPILLGIRAEQGGIPMAGMSEGTRDQLYLALRLASIERYLEKNTPLPIVLDDILINFDDQRAQAALRILGELSKKYQILFFTHHARLVELARQTVETEQLVIHELATH